jgi:hypothetical protein
MIRRHLFLESQRRLDVSWEGQFRALLKCIFLSSLPNVQFSPPLETQFVLALYYADSVFR